jgi:uncharacterized protein (TIGR03435 family)
MVSAGTVSFTCQTLLTYIRSAYTRFAPGGPVRIQGGPPWVDKDLYQITAKAEGAASVATTAGPMMQTLLEDRFKLKTHTETEEVPAYAIVVAKKAAPKLPVAKVACFTPFAENPFPRLKQGESPPPLCGSGIFKEDGIEVRGSTMTEFCLALSKMPLRLDCRKIIDKTGVVGRFDFDLRFPPDFPELPVEQGVQAAPQTSLG